MLAATAVSLSEVTSSFSKTFVVPSRPLDGLKHSTLALEYSADIARPSSTYEKPASS